MGIDSVSEIVKQYPGGSVRKFVLDDGYSFETYVPDNYNPSTPIMIYEHGDGGYYNDWKSYMARFSEGECNAIIVRADRFNSMALYNHVVEKCNLQPERGITVSFSGGTPFAMRETVQMIEQYPNTDPPLAVILDGYPPTGILQADGSLKKMMDADTVFLGFSQGAGGTNYDNQYKALARAGANMIIFYDKSSYGMSHVGVDKSFMENGIFEYILGEGKLPDNYVIKAYVPKADGTGREWITIDSESIDEIDDVYDFFGIDTLQSRVTKLSQISNYAIKSDNLSLSFYLNNIIRNVRNTNFLGMNFNSFSGSSTTSVPSEIPSVVKRHFSDAARTMDKIVSLTDSVNEIHVRYEELDSELTKLVNNK